MTSVWYSNIAGRVSRAEEVKNEINYTHLAWPASLVCKYFMISHDCLLFSSVMLCFTENYKVEKLVKNKFMFASNLVREGR